MELDLDKIFEALEMTNETSQAFYNVDTGEVEWLNEFVCREEYEGMVEKIDCGNYICLPSQYDINEYSIMEDFIYSLSNREIQDKLQRAINGKGAFRRFKDMVNYLGIEKKWYTFRDETYRSLALKWCKENELIESEDDTVNN